LPIVERGGLIHEGAREELSDLMALSRVGLDVTLHFKRRHPDGSPLHHPNMIGEPVETPSGGTCHACAFTGAVVQRACNRPLDKGFSDPGGLRRQWVFPPVAERGLAAARDDLRRRPTPQFTLVANMSNRSTKVIRAAQGLDSEASHAPLGSGAKVLFNECHRLWDTGGDVSRRDDAVSSSRRGPRRPWTTPVTPRATRTAILEQVFLRRGRLMVILGTTR
jgi:hypothetical protein